MTAPGHQRPVRIAVLGCAAIARRRMLPAFEASPHTQVTCVASRNGRRAAELAGQYGCAAVDGYEAALADAEADAVYVPLPAALHATWVEKALLAGKHVLAEKPLTLHRRKTAELGALARERGLALMENVMFVHHAQHERVRQLVADGVIGELRTFQAMFTVPRLPDGDIRFDPGLGGGALTDTGVYPVRAALHLLGAGLQVVGSSLTRGVGFTVDTAGAALLRSPQGVTAQLSFGLDHGYRSAYELGGSQGRIVLDRAFTPPPDHHPVIRVENRDGSTELKLAPEDQVAATVAAFAAAVRAAAPLDEASLEQARVLDEVRRHALGGPLPAESA
ncbi:Gfo/Idh/MocA family oxidoreductase [Streptomyces sp. NBC_01549]|uniref:Gfo/Idh/MocA family protein n=1 Tax=Streptomyces sp. NBC_01549 TaxID=2975874 RepID=UPI00224DDBAA|nr:Gfo/Idh/MocA family oxidoreductase [Streptomyces sp. NBC_01549]MCX4591819.1 Gfo/Idh/MocA family oxidoreductase [Streptomyces sp. NBC_01549]